MNVVPAICPMCQGSTPIAEDAGEFVCSYCGTQLVIDDGSVKRTVVYRDEARVRETELQQQIALKQLEIAETKARERKRVAKVTAIAAAVLLALGLLLESVGNAMGACTIMLAMISAMAAFMFVESDGDVPGGGASAPAENEAASSQQKTDAERTRSGGESLDIVKTAAGAASVLGAVAMLIKPWKR